MKYCKESLGHRIADIIIVLLIFGIPLLRADFPANRAVNGVDAVSSASVILEQPSGEYIVVINKTLHPDQEKLSAWRDFFAGKEIPVIFEDISCVVGASDSAGYEMARSLQSRLPENQMRLRTENPVFMLSKADHGRFDVMLLSREAAEAYQFSEPYEEAGYVTIRFGRTTESLP